MSKRTETAREDFGATSDLDPFQRAACAALGEVTRKYPRASAGVKAAVDREQKRVKC